MITAIRRITAVRAIPLPRRLRTAVYTRDVMRRLLADLLDTYPLCKHARVVDLPDSIENDG